MFGCSNGQFLGGCFALYFAGLIAAAGGVGGGGLIVPILLLIFEYELAASIALSDCMVVGSSLAQFIINITKRHPNYPRRPLIYWELVLTLLPAQLGGANIGEILSRMAPKSFIYILALLVLLFASTITLRKGLHKWHEENEKFLKENINSPSTVEQIEPAVFTGRFSQIFEFDRSKSNESSKQSFQNQGSSSMFETFRESLSIYTDKSKLKLPTAFIATIVIMWVAYTGLSVGRTEVSRCSKPYLIFLGIIYVPLLVGHIASFRLNHSIDSSDDDLSQPLAEDVDASSNDIDLNSNIIPLVCCAYLIGVICSMLGLGGGEIFSPMILSYGVIPQVTSGTTATMSLLNSLTEVIRDITEGTIQPDVGVIIFGVGFLGGLTGRQLGLWIAAKYGRASVIVFFLSFGLYLSCLYYIYELSSTSFDSKIHGFC